MTTDLRDRSPAHYEQLADDACKRGDYKAAAQLYDQAAGACIGHGRADRYRESAIACRQMAANKLAAM